MLVTLNCPTSDVSATALGLRLNGPMPGVLTDRVIVAEWNQQSTQLHLGIIGASHVATVTLGAASFREEISCFAGDPGSLVSQHIGGYTLRAATKHCLDFSAEASDILAQCSGDDWLIARFPGVGEHHLTAVRGEFVAGIWHWETHHLYPEEAIIVSTESRYEL
ncbi:DUF2617 family protein [Corynebacterium sp. H128]|uniref:DUF2617 family protein n=1 Tax=unclassified Corynebacterium TaxID=2624378 RepID=UPI00309586E5